MARPKLDELRGVADFSTMWRWDVAFTFPASLTGIPTTSEVNVRCESSALPTAAVQEFMVNIRGQEVRVPGILKYGGTIDMTFIETVDNKISAMIKAWRDALWAPNTGVMADTVANLKSRIILTRLDSKDAGVWKYTLIGTWPGPNTLPTVDGNTNDAVKPGVTWNYDRFEDGPA